MATPAASRSAFQQSMTPTTASAMHIQCVPMSASGISVVAQPAEGSAAPTQQIRVLQAASAQPQVVHQPQQYQVIQQQPQQQISLGAAQGNAGITLIQTASGQLLLQQPQVLEQPDSATGSQGQMVVNNSNHQQVNYANVQGVHLTGGIQLQSGVAAQPVVLQQQAVTPSNRNIVVQTVPVASAANSANVIHLSGQQTHDVSLSRPTSSDQNGVLVQIGGQTYRMQAVQQVQVANTVRPPQQTQVQRHIAPAASSQPSAVTKQITLATLSRPSAMPTPGQTITLTPAQLAMLKQTPVEKQLGMIQMLSLIHI